MDALQFYSGVPIASNQLSPLECQGVPHHFLGELEPHQLLNVSLFVHEAVRRIEALHQREVLPLLVGGSMMYLEALLTEGAFGEEEQEEEEEEEGPQKKEVEERLRSLTSEELWAELDHKDRHRAHHIHPHDRQRLLSALLSSQAPQPPSSPSPKRLRWPVLFLELTCPPPPPQ